MTERNSNPGTETKSLSIYGIHCTASVLHEPPAYWRLCACVEEGGCRVIDIRPACTMIFIPAATTLVFDRLEEKKCTENIIVWLCILLVFEIVESV